MSDTFCKRPCKGCGEKYIILGTGRKYCVECDPKLKGVLRRLSIPPYKARLTNLQMVMILDLQSEFQKYNQAMIAKKMVLDELAQMAENERMFAEVLERNGLDASGRKIESPEVSVTPRL